jgi:hypothetical protein
MKKHVFLVCERGCGKPFMVTAALGAYGPDTVENALASWIRDAVACGQPYMADIQIMYGKRMRAEGVGIMEIAPESVVMISGEVGVLHNKNLVGNEEVVMSTLKELAKALADALGQRAAQIDYGNIVCRLEVEEE